MGTLERLRKTSPYVLAAFAIIFVGFMVASDADISNLLKQGTNYQTAAIGEVNGVKILYKDFENKVKEAIDQQKSQTKEGEDMSVDEVQIRRQIWQQMVDDVLLKQQAEKMGIFVTKDEVLDVLLDNPPEYLRKPFTDSLGRFQKESYLEIVTNPEVILNRLPQTMSMEEKKNVVSSFRNDLLKIQKYLLEEKLSESMRACVNAAGTFISPTYVKQKYINDNSFVDFSFIQLDFHQIPDKSVTVSDQEIEKYYENVSKYNKTKAKRKIKFVLFQLAPSDKDTAQAIKAIKKITTEIAAAKAVSSGNADTVFSKKMKEFQGQHINYTLINDIQQNLMNYLTNMATKEVAGPIQLPDGTYFIRLDDKRTGENEVVKASHILISFGENKDSAKAEAQKIMDKAKKGDFAELAREYSSDKGSAMSGGDLGYFGKGKMVKPFEEAAFAAKPGSIVGPVESQFGYHIIKVTDKKSEEIKYSMIKISVETSRATIKALARNAKEIKTKAENGQSFDEAAKFFLKTPRETDFFDMEKPILSSNYLTSLAFETEVGKVIEPIEIKGYGFVVAQVIDSREAGLVPLKDMKEKIKSILIKSKKLDALKANAESAYNSVRNAGQLAAAGAQFAVKTAANVSNNGMVTGVGQDFALTEFAMTAPSGVISGPYRCETGWYIIQVTNRKVPDAAAISGNLQGFTNQLKTSTSQTTYYQWLQQVHEDADIKDFRAKFFKEY